MTALYQIISGGEVNERPLAETENYHFESAEVMDPRVLIARLIRIRRAVSEVERASGVPEGHIVVSGGNWPVTRIDIFGISSDLSRDAQVKLAVSLKSIRQRSLKILAAQRRR